MQRFTDLFIKNLEPGEKEYAVREPDGFMLRVRPSGVKSWLFVYNYQGRRRNMTLGAYPELGLRAAREALTRARALLARGVDPGEAKQEEKRLVAAERLQPTVQALAAEYLERHAKATKKSWAEDMRILNKDVIPAWGRRKAKDITRRDVALLVQCVAGRGGVMANRTLAVIRRMFNFGVEQGLIDFSPVTHIKPPAKEKPRERILSPGEISCFWQGLETAPMSEYLRIALKLMLSTGQRKGEVLSARWEEFDLETLWWTMPGDKVKNGQSHRVPLNEIAVQLLEELHALGLPGPWLFPSLIRDNVKPVTATSLDHALRRCDFGIPHFTPHDLRRTVATCLGGLGFNRLVQDKILNHVDRTVGGIYDRHSYDLEKRRALEAWGQRLEEIVSGVVCDKVIEFPRRKEVL
jgi:integrase